MLMVNQLVGFGAQPLAGFTVTMKALISATTDASTYTFSSVNITPTTSDRLVAILWAARNVGGVARTLSSMTINGSGVSQHYDTATAVANLGGVTSLALASGDTTDIVLNFSGTVNNCVIWPIILSGLVSTTPHDGDASASTGATSRALNLTIPVGGAGFALVRKQNTNDATWTNLTENEEITVETNSYAAAYQLTGDGVDTLRTASWTGSNPCNMTVVSWG